MAGFLVLTHTVNDVEKYTGEYIPQVMPILQKHGIEPIVAEFNTAAVEGKANAVVVLKGPSTDAITAFLGDPDYKGPLALRHSITSDRTAVVAPAFAGVPA